MGPLELVLGIIILVMAVALIVLVLAQSGKDKKLSGSITGAADTFFAKGKTKTRDKALARITTVFVLAFGIIAVALYIIVA